MVQINYIALFSFLAATLAAPAYKSTYGEEDNVVSINPCFYYDGACHSCPRSEFWDGQCHKFPGDDIIMPGNGKHANGKGYVTTGSAETDMVMGTGTMEVLIETTVEVSSAEKAELMLN
ncbi:hypothetical protein DSO57_1011537 [Entomophthora muscae]|uniref:Uncharacterized protein n=1 Tax=Entomophthora muscae TaxID=34485 RepID=A0ACC2T774_9FUNG|nr:hypothetical protein DSO57_1011537 [Entomophthora muscae]